MSSSSSIPRPLTYDNYPSVGRELARLRDDPEKLELFASQFTQKLPEDAFGVFPDASETKMLDRLTEAFQKMAAFRRDTTIGIEELKAILLFGEQIQWPQTYLTPLCRVTSPYVAKANYPSLDGVQPVPYDVLTTSKTDRKFLEDILGSCLWTVTHLPWPMAKKTNAHMLASVQRLFQIEAFQLLRYLVLDEKKVIFPLSRQ